jgi:ABC-type antimicrobial peptide transport system permease subunit
MQNSRPQIFVPLAQHPAPRVFLIARATADPLTMTTAFEEAIADLDPGFSRPSVVTGEALVRDNIGDLLEQSTLAIVLAVVALILSSLGIYGVVAFMVASRTREMGVRIALGATRRRVVNTVLIDTCILIVPGLVIGVGLAILVVHETGLLWQQLGAAEPLAYAAAVAAALAVSLLASLPSAHRAATVEPLDAIRAE